MKLKQLAAAALFGGALIAAGPAFAQAQEKLTVWWGKGFYKAEDDALFAAIKKFEAKYPKYKVELSLYAPQEMIPKTRGRARRRQPARRGLWRRLRLPGHRQVGLRRQARGRVQRSSSRSAPSSSRRRCRPPSSTTTWPRRGPTTPTRSSSRPCTSSTGRTCWPRPASRKATSRRTGRATGTSGATRCSPPTARRPASAASAPASRWAWIRATRSISFLTFMDAYNVKLVSDSGKLLVDDPAVRDGLINAMTDYTYVYGKGCTPPSSTDLEGPGQQRRLPQQDHRADAQRDDLDRRQVARRHEQRRAHRSAARHGEEELHRADRHRRLPEQARRHQDDLPRGGEDRRDLQGREEQGRRQEVRRLHARRADLDALRRRLARPLVPGDQGRRSRARSGRATRTAWPSTTSSWPARRRSNSPRTTSSRC